MVRFWFAGITSGRGYAHCEVGIAYIDIESVCILRKSLSHQAVLQIIAIRFVSFIDFVF